MLSLLIEDNDTTIKDLDKTQLSKIVEWFQSSDMVQNRYAMGINSPVTYDDIHEKYLEVLINAHEFFLGISLDEELVGFIKGRVDYRDKSEVWIMAMLIDASHRSKGLGKRVLELIIDEFNDKMGITSFYTCLISENVQAKSFWKQNGFMEHRLSKGYFTIDNKSHDLVIMQRIL